MRPYHLQQSSGKQVVSMVAPNFTKDVAYVSHNEISVLLTLTSGSFFITFFMRARGKGGCLKSGISCSAVSTCRCQNERKKSGSRSPGCTYAVVGWSCVMFEHLERSIGYELGGALYCKASAVPSARGEYCTLYSSECIQAGLEVGVGWLPVHVDPSIGISIYSSLIDII